MSSDELPGIFRACLDNLEELECLLRGGANPNMRTADDESLLTFVIVWKRTQSVKTLIRAGADYEQTDSAWSPLMYAAFEGHVEIVDELLKAGADPRRTDAHGRRAADLAESASYWELAQQLRKAADTSE